jgi:signal recognition particle receptor subunit beta
MTFGKGDSMFINWQLRQLNLKVVYYGPALSGKTTNLEQIHAKIDPSRRGDLVSLKTAEDRTLYFDFLQLELGKINGLTPKIQLYTVPGQAYYEVSRKLVLRGADGVVFVADSGANRLSDNIDAWNNMKKHLIALGIPLDRLPVIVQLNKRDLPNAMPPSILISSLNCQYYKTLPAIAARGDGVFDTLKAVINGVVQNIQREMA